MRRTRYNPNDGPGQGYGPGGFTVVDAIEEAYAEAGGTTAPPPLPISQERKESIDTLAQKVAEAPYGKRTQGWFADVVDFAKEHYVLAGTVALATGGAAYYYAPTLGLAQQYRYAVSAAAAATGVLLIEELLRALRQVRDQVAQEKPVDLTYLEFMVAYPLLAGGTIAFYSLGGSLVTHTQLGLPWGLAVPLGIGTGFAAVGLEYVYFMAFEWVKGEVEESYLGKAVGWIKDHL